MSDSAKRTKILIYALYISLIIALIGIGYKLKNTEAALLAKTNAINSLAREIGLIKEQNNYLNQNIDALNNTFVDLLNQSLKEKEELAKETNELQNIKDTLKTRLMKRILPFKTFRKRQKSSVRLPNWNR
jgi:chromosome segregation ATPase